MEQLRAKLTPYAPLFLRLGIALVFITFGAQKLITPAQTRGEIQLLLNLGLGPVSVLNYYLGLTEVITGIALAVGVFVNIFAPVAVFLATSFLVSFFLKYQFHFDPGLYRDFAVIGGAAALWLYGAGPFSIDAWRAKKKGGAQSSPHSTTSNPTDTQKKEPVPQLPPPGVLQ